MAENFSDVFLKDDPRIIKTCAACEREQNIDQKPIFDAGWDISHGICARHKEKFLKMAGIPADKLEAVMKTSIERGLLARDLSETKNKPLVDWLKNPPAYQAKEPVPA